MRVPDMLALTNDNAHVGQRAYPLAQLSVASRSMLGGPHRAIRVEAARCMRPNETLRTVSQDGWSPAIVSVWLALSQVLPGGVDGAAVP